MRIMHICTDSGFGGAVVTLHRIVEFTRREDIEHIVIIPGCSVLYDDFLRLGVRVLPLSDADKSFSFKDLFHLINLMLKLHPHIVHTHGSVTGRIAAFLCGVRSRIYTRHTYNDQLSSRATRFINRIVTTRAVAVSGVLVGQIVNSGITHEKIHVINNGVVRYDTANDDSNRKYNLLYIGRIVKGKGLDTALSAIRKLRALDSRFTLTIVGDGKYKSEIEKSINANGIADLVFVCPSTRNIKKYLFMSGIAINCSYENEATACFILEGMSAGMVPLVSSAGGNPCVVSDKKTGRVYTSGDVDSLVECALDIINNYDYYKNNSFERYLSTYTVDVMADNYLKLWEVEYELYYS